MGQHFSASLSFRVASTDGGKGRLVKVYEPPGVDSDPTMYPLGGGAVTVERITFVCAERGDGTYGYRGISAIPFPPDLFSDLFLGPDSIDLAFEVEAEAVCRGSVDEATQTEPIETPLNPALTECLSTAGVLIDQCSEVAEGLISAASSAAGAVLEASIEDEVVGASVSFFSGTVPMVGVRCDLDFDCSGLWFENQNASGQSFDLGDGWSIGLDHGRLTMVAPALGRVDGAASLVGIGDVTTVGGVVIPDAPIILDQFTMTIETPLGYTRLFFDLADLSAALGG